MRSCNGQAGSTAIRDCHLGLESAGYCRSAFARPLGQTPVEREEEEGGRPEGGLSIASTRCVASRPFDHGEAEDETVPTDGRRLGTCSVVPSRLVCTLSSCLCRPDTSKCASSGGPRCSKPLPSHFQRLKGPSEHTLPQSMRWHGQMHTVGKRLGIGHHSRRTMVICTM